MSKTCYMCKKLANSDEHVPPKCLFPEKKDLTENVDLRKQLITVPSCDEHNSRKSNDDEYILYALVISIPSNEFGKNHFLTKIMRAIARNPSLINKFLGNHQQVIVEDNETGIIRRSIGIQIDTLRFENAISHLVRALYYHHFKTKWSGDLKIFPNFLLSFNEKEGTTINEHLEKMANYSDELFSKSDFYGENPDVFKYQIINGPDERCHKLMRLHFYNGNKITILIGTRDNLLEN